MHVRLKPVPVAARYKAWVCSPSSAETAGSNSVWGKYVKNILFVYSHKTQLNTLRSVWGMDVCCECCVLAGTSLCGELITRPEESYQQWRIVVCYLETSRMSRPFKKN